MKFLINASNIHAGGGMQVTDSFCKMLYKYKNHQFVVVLSSFFQNRDKLVANMDNVELIKYDIEIKFKSLWGRNYFLDELVNSRNVDAVLTVFGPSYWKPNCPHLCGMARSHLVLYDSPFFSSVSLKNRVKYKMWKYFFMQCSSFFYTENPFITERLSSLFGKNKKVYTVTNYYHQIYDNRDEWDNSIDLPSFSGTTIITVSSSNPHKNFSIMAGVINYMKMKYPNFKFRFVLTQELEECPFVKDEMMDYFVFLGKVDVRCCPHLYEQSDIMFLPSLLECFSATYPEAMRMEKPIVTTDLEFAQGLCGDAACYYSATDASSASEAIYRVATDKSYAQKLVANGKKQLLTYDNYSQRANKLIHILEEIS